MPPPAPPSELVAAFDPTLHVPTCAGIGSSCTSGSTLINGTSSNIEPNGDNALDVCTDGNSATYHVDESIDKITVYTVGGGQLQPGATAAIEAKVWAWGDGSADTADFYFATNTSNTPNWQYLGSESTTSGGLNTLTRQYTIPSGSAIQAVRVNFRFGGGNPSSCSGGAWADTDDLAFAIDTENIMATGATNPIPAFPTEPLKSSVCATIGKKNKERCDTVSVCEWRNRGRNGGRNGGRKGGRNGGRKGGRNGGRNGTRGNGGRYQSQGCYPKK